MLWSVPDHSSKLKIIIAHNLLVLNINFYVLKIPTPKNILLYNQKCTYFVIQNFQNDSDKIRKKSFILERIYLLIT